MPLCLLERFSLDFDPLESLSVFNIELHFQYLCAFGIIQEFEAYIQVLNYSSPHSVEFLQKYKLYQAFPVVW